LGVSPFGERACDAVPGEPIAARANDQRLVALIDTARYRVDASMKIAFDGFLVNLGVLAECHRQQRLGSGRRLLTGRRAGIIHRLLG
jgi:hypothetical protein